MTFFIWSQLALVCLLGAMSPGPSLALIIRNSINFSRLAGIFTSLGHGMGIGIYATFAVIGLGFIIQKSEAIFFIIQVCGSLFLMLLGLLFVFTKKNASESSSYQIHSNSFAQGFAIAIINPKILIFFIAIYSQFINADAELIEKTILVSTSAIIDAIWYIFISVLVTGYGLKEFLFNNRHVIQKIIGALLIFIALSLLYNLTNN